MNAYGAVIDAELALFLDRLTLGADPAVPHPVAANFFRQGF